MTALETFIETQRAEVERTLASFDAHTFDAAAQIIWDAQAAGNRIHITGIGKPAHVAGYMASLMSVSYTHLDVYKRQGTRTASATTRTSRTRPPASSRCRSGTPRSP